MAEILAFRPKPDPLVALRQELARALDVALDIVDGLVARLDALEGDTDFEPDADLEATAAEWAGRGPHRFDHGLDDHGGAA